MGNVADGLYITTVNQEKRDYEGLVNTTTNMNKQKAMLGNNEESSINQC